MPGGRCVAGGIRVAARSPRRRTVSWCGESASSISVSVSNLFTSYAGEFWEKTLHAVYSTDDVDSLWVRLLSSIVKALGLSSIPSLFALDINLGGELSKPVSLSAGSLPTLLSGVSNN